MKHRAVLGQIRSEKAGFKVRADISLDSTKVKQRRALLLTSATRRGMRDVHQ